MTRPRATPAEKPVYVKLEMILAERITELERERDFLRETIRVLISDKFVITRPVNPK